MAGGGYDIGASLAVSGSSGASLSGATDLSGGGNYGGNSYGPGSLIMGSATPGGPTYLVWVLVAAVVLFGIWAVRKIFT